VILIKVSPTQVGPPLEPPHNDIKTCSPRHIVKVHVYSVLIIVPNELNDGDDE
jgi:hypothetical protein